MRKHNIGTRCMAWLLLAAMLMSFVPAIPIFAATESANAAYDIGFRGADEEGVTLLDNGENTSLSIKINNFVNDGILFEYLQQNRHEFQSAEEYMLEFVHGEQDVSYVQLYPYHLRNKDNFNDSFMEDNGFSKTIKPNGTLDASASTTGDATGKHSDGTTANRPLRSIVYTQSGDSDIDVGETPFLRLQSTVDTGTASERAWTKLTTFNSPVSVDNVRYAVIVYRLPNSAYSSALPNFGLTINSYNETGNNKSQYVHRGTIGSNNWQYAIIDMLGGNISDNAKISSVYLQTPLAQNATTSRSFDIAAVGYFPYYGDAEQFAYYGVSMGSAKKYLYTYNGAFSFHNYAVFDDDEPDHDYYDGNPTILVDTIANVVNKNGKQILDRSKVSGSTVFSSSNSTADDIGFDLFGTVQSGSVMGLMQPYLENGRPVYKPQVVEYVATAMQKLLTGVEEYPADNNGWRNYGFITGSSTSNGTNEALFGTVKGNENSQSMDMGTAICKQLNIAKGSGTLSGNIGDYESSRAKADKLIGSWNKCKDNFETWMDVAYYLLHNLYVTETETANDKDGYGKYETDYQSLVMPQAIVNGEKTYFFDSSYAYNLGFKEGQYLPEMWGDNPPFESALVFDKDQHYITLNTDADGRAMYCGGLVLFPFLPTSGNGTQDGETNSPYYMHGGNNRQPMGSTYEGRDYLYSMTGSGYFQYNHAENLYFNFEGDDDVYLFINGQMVLDVGGCHRSVQYAMNLNDYVDWARDLKSDSTAYAKLNATQKARVDALCLEDGQLYDFSFFYMDRHGNGANLRIITNIAMGLDVDKQAYQNGHEVTDKGLVNPDKAVEYSFTLKNDTDYKLYDLVFDDPDIGVSLTPQNGLVVKNVDLVTNAYGSKLMPNNLKITVDGFDENGNKLNQITVSCANNEELMQFLHNLASDNDTGLGDVDSLYAGDGLWKDATVTIRGIYYNLTAGQREQASFTNTVTVSAVNKKGSIMSGSAMHTVHLTSNALHYYQWVGKEANGNDRSITITRDKLRNDLINGGYVADASALPEPGHMILIPSDMSGTEIVDDHVSNTPGGNVYLKVCYTSPGTYMAYVTIRDKYNPEFAMTVPLLIYAVGGQDSVFVLDYGLDSILTQDDAMFDYELDTAVGATGTFMGVSDDTVTHSYDEFEDGIFNENREENFAGNADNPLEVMGYKTNDDNHRYVNAHYKLNTPVYLDHNKPWVVEWRAQINHFNTEMLFSMEEVGETDGNMFIFARNDKNGLNIISMGTCKTNGTSKEFHHYGVVGANLEKTTTYQLRNVPNVDGTNMVYLYVKNVDTGEMELKGAMTAYYKNYQSQNKNDTWISGKDFTFNYIGTSDYTIDKGYPYIRVYEDGKQLTNYAWEMKNGVLAAKDTGKIGYAENAVTLEGGTINADGTMVAKDAKAVHWSLAEPAVLSPDQYWEVSFKTQLTKVTAILHQNNGFYNGSQGLYVFPSQGMVGITVRYQATVNNQEVRYNNVYATKISDYIPGFEGDKEHTYTLKNQINPDGTNMVYLYVDDIYAGPLSMHYKHDSNGKLTLLSQKTNALSGLTLKYGYIGHGNTSHGFAQSSTLSSMSIYQNTRLSSVYEWAQGKVNPSDTYSQLLSKNDLKENGNQIVFNGATDTDKDDLVEITQNEGKFTMSTNEETGKKELEFEAGDFMDEKYSIYVALTIHDSDFNPTALEANTIDIAKEVQIYKKVTVLPASVVYYEDDFPALKYPGGDNTFTVIGNSLEMNQSPDQHTPQGSDPTYAGNSGTNSAGTLHTIAINKDGPLAWFSFKGTGFEISARTNAEDTGLLIVKVYDKKTVTMDGNTLTVGSAQPLKTIPVISEFKNNTEDNSEAIYQVPLIRCDCETLGDYVVLIEGVEMLDYGNNMDHINTYLYLDGIRIYQPMGANVGEYGNENNAVYKEIRNLILSGDILACDYESKEKQLQIGSETVTWTENFNNKNHLGAEYTGVAGSVNDYLIKGPNNEVYMIGGTDILSGETHNGALAFYVKEDLGNDAGASKLLHIGARAMDMGKYYGKASTGLNAQLYLGTVSADGIGWMPLATLKTGTEQYVNIPYELCPVEIIDGKSCYQVVIRIGDVEETAPMMVSFSNLKMTNGLTLSEPQFMGPNVEQNHTDGSWKVKTNTQTFRLMRSLSLQMSADRIHSLNEVESGSGFIMDSVQAELDSLPQILPKFPSLSLMDEVIYNVYFDIANLDNVPMSNMGLITFDTKLTNGTIADAADVIPGAVYVDGYGYYRVSTHGIPAKNLGDVVYFKVYAQLEDGTYVYSDIFAYHAVAYAQDILANSTSEEMKSLVVAMLNYGAAAQNYFGYKTDTLMNACLTAQQQALVGSYDAGMVTGVQKVPESKISDALRFNGGYSDMYPAVNFAGAFAINYYMTPTFAVDGALTVYYWDEATYNSADVLTAENAAGTLPVTQMSDGRWLAAYTGITARKIDTMVYVAAVYASEGVSYSSGVVAYSLGAYCVDRADNPEMGQLAQATAVYGWYAKKYFADKIA